MKEKGLMLIQQRTGQEWTTTERHEVEVLAFLENGIVVRDRDGFIDMAEYTTQQSPTHYHRKIVRLYG